MNKAAQIAHFFDNYKDYEKYVKNNKSGLINYPQTVETLNRNGRSYCLIAKNTKEFGGLIDRIYRAFKGIILFLSIVYSSHVYANAGDYFGKKYIDVSCYLEMSHTEFQKYYDSRSRIPNDMHFNQFFTGYFEFFLKQDPNSLKALESTFGSRAQHHNISILKEKKRISEFVTLSPKEFCDRYPKNSLIEIPEEIQRKKALSLLNEIPQINTLEALLKFISQNTPLIEPNRLRDKALELFKTTILFSDQWIKVFEQGILDINSGEVKNLFFETFSARFPSSQDIVKIDEFISFLNSLKNLPLSKGINDLISSLDKEIIELKKRETTADILIQEEWMESLEYLNETKRIADLLHMDEKKRKSFSKLNFYLRISGVQNIEPQQLKDMSLLRHKVEHEIENLEMKLREVQAPIDEINSNIRQYTAAIWHCKDKLSIDRIKYNIDELYKKNKLFDDASVKLQNKLLALRCSNQWMIVAEGKITYMDVFYKDWIPDFLQFNDPINQFTNKNIDAQKEKFFQDLEYRFKEVRRVKIEQLAGFCEASL